LYVLIQIKRESVEWREGPARARKAAKAASEGGVSAMGMVPMKNKFCIAFAAALLSGVALPAFAADLPSTKEAPPVAPVEDFMPFMVRVGALGVLPNGSGATLNGFAPLGLYNSSLTNNVVPELDLTYFINNHWAVEAICCFAHSTLEAAVTPFGLKSNIANTTAFPPTVTLQYHFALGQFDPYVGLGVNYTWFWWTTSPLTQALGKGNGINVHGAAGVAFDAGFDYYVTRHWVINADAKYIPLETDANVLGVQNAAHINVNPWLVRLAIGYRFGLQDLGLGAPVVAKY
jgi:outer membrane protein